jgi:hypothetical protein
LPVWRRSEGEGAFALLVTPAGLSAIGTDEQPRPAARKAAQRAQAPRRSKETTAAKRKVSPQRRRAPKAAGSKQDKILDLLRRPQGATNPVLMKATGWQAHSVRGFFAGTVRNKLKLKLTSDKGDGDRVYRIAPPRKPKRSSGKRAA